MKRLLSVLLAALLVFATMAVAFAAEDDPTPDMPALGGNKNPVIYFNAGSVGWESAKWVAFHIWEINGDPFNDWGAKAERGTKAIIDSDPDAAVWQFDFTAKGITLEDDKQYGVIFYNDKGGQTYNLLFDTTCFEDTADCDTENTFENPEDSEKIAYPAYWHDQDPEVNGPELKLSSVGNVVGTCLPRGVTTVDLLADFLVNILENVRKFTDLTDQEIVDNIGKNLGMNRDEAKEAITTAAVEVEWDYDASVLPFDEPISGGTVDYPVSVEVIEGEGAAVSDKEKITVTSGVAPWYYFDTLTLTAIPAEGYQFVRWEIEGTINNSTEEDQDAFIENPTLYDAEVTIRACSEIKARAYFEVIPEPPTEEPTGFVMIYFDADVIEGEGTAAVSTTMLVQDAGETVTLTATPADGYEFVTWDIEGIYEITEGSLTSPELVIMPTTNILAHANFAPTEEPPAVLRGDYDGDGQITIMDATRAQRILADLEERPAEELLIKLDADGDGMLTIMDATRIQRVLADLCDWEGNPVSHGEVELPFIPV